MANENSGKRRRGAIETLLHRVVNHRLLFNSKAEAEAELGPLKNLTSERRIEELTRRLDRRVRKRCLLSLEDIMDDYDEAREVFLSESMRDGRTGRVLRREVREQIAVGLFEWAYVAQDERGFGRKWSSQRGVNLDMFRRYCSEARGLEDVDVCFTILMHRGIVCPLRTGAKDYKPGQERNRRMRRLLLDLKAQMPPVGIFRTVPDLESALREIEKAIIEGRELTAFDYWWMLYGVGMTYWNMTACDPMRNAQLSTYDLPLPGLWVDEDDGGRSRFWVFPSNLKAAFSFTRDEDGRWTFDAFEFIMTTHDLEDNDISKDFAVWAAFDYSRNIIARPGSVIEESDAVKYYGIEPHWRNSEIVRFNMTPLGNPEARTVTFRRIGEDFAGYGTFRSVIRSVVRLKSRHIPMIKVYDALLAVDEDFIYLRDKDWRREQFGLEEDEDGYFAYEMEEAALKAIPRNLIEVLSRKGEGADGIRVYALPRKLHDSESVVYEGRLARLKYVMKHLTLQNQVTIYRFDDDEPVIFFNDYSVGMTWREALALNLREL